MGAGNALRVYDTYGAVLGDHALRALVRMALHALDDDPEPWFGLGWEWLSENAYQRPVPDKHKDRKGYDAALRAVGRAMEELEKTGAIRTADRARYGRFKAQHARYRLYLDAPFPEADEPGRLATPSDADRPMGNEGPQDGERHVVKRPSDAERHVDNDTPQDGERPMAGPPPDAERPMTTGRSASIHMTENVVLKEEGGVKTSPPTPQRERPLWPAPVPDPEGEGEKPDDKPSRSPDVAEGTLVARIRAIRPDWPRAAIRAALHDPRVQERPWPLVCVAALAVARDPESQQPGRLAHGGPWWHQTPADRPSAPPKICPTHLLPIGASGECRGCAGDRKAASE